MVRHFDGLLVQGPKHIRVLFGLICMLTYPYVFGGLFPQPTGRFYCRIVSSLLVSPQFTSPEHTYWAYCVAFHYRVNIIVVTYVIIQKLSVNVLNGSSQPLGHINKIGGIITPAYARSPGVHLSIDHNHNHSVLQALSLYQDRKHEYVIVFVLA